MRTTSAERPVLDLDDPARLAALHDYDLLDRPAGPELEAVLWVAATVAGVPTATLNLIDSQRQCQLTTVGFEGGDSPRDESMCAITLAYVGDFVHLPDARRDPRYADNPWVTGEMADVRFYAAAPLLTPEGCALGTLCVFDNVTHRLNDEQIARLKDLAGVIVALFERRKQARVQERLNQELAERTDQLHATVAELERSNQELQRFAAVASHDLLAPLAVVAGYLEELDDSYGERLGERSRSWLRRMLDATSRMRELIDSLLAYAKAGAGHFHPDATSIQQLVDVVVLDLLNTITAAGAHVTTDGELPVIRCDRVAIRQLFQNLITNGIKFAHPQRPPRIVCSAERTAEGWTFAVADNGRGIPAEKREEVFGMFARLDSSRATPGHGIGLATCQRIVERHGGRIWAEETPGGGTTIRFTIPAPGRG